MCTDALRTLPANAFEWFVRRRASNLASAPTRFQLYTGVRVYQHTRTRFRNFIRSNWSKCRFLAVPTRFHADRQRVFKFLDVDLVPCFRSTIPRLRAQWAIELAKGIFDVLPTLTCALSNFTLYVRRRASNMACLKTRLERPVHRRASNLACTPTRFQLGLLPTLFQLHTSERIYPLP